MAVASLFAVAATVNAEDIPNAADQKTGAIWRHETASGINELLEPENGVYGIHTFNVDANDWDSQFFIVIADANLAAGTPVDIKFDYRKDGDGAVKFNAQGHTDPHAYANNDGWSELEATNDWQTYEGSFEVSSEMRTLAVNASIARDNGTLYLRNISIQVNYDDAVVTKETDADAAEMEAAVEIKMDTVIVNYTVNNLLAADQLGGIDAEAGLVSGRDTRNDHNAFPMETIKYNDEDVYGLYIDTAVMHNPWDAQFFVNFDAVSTTLNQVSKTANAGIVFSVEFSTNYAGAGSFNVHNGNNANAKWGFATPESGKWTTFTDTLYAVEGIFQTLKAKDGSDSAYAQVYTCYEFQVGGKKGQSKDGNTMYLPNHAAAWNIFFKNVKLDVVTNLPEKKEEAPVAVTEVAAATINAYVANGVLYASAATDVVIYNISGVAVKAAKNVTTLNVADLKSGLYIAKVGNKAIKFVK